MEVWYHRGLVFVMGYMVLLPEIVLPMIMLFIYLGKWWIISLFVIKTWVIVVIRLSGWTFPGFSGLLKLVMKHFFVWGWQGLGSKKCSEKVFSSPNDIHGIVNFSENPLCNCLVITLLCLYVHWGSDNYPMWGQYTILDLHGVTNKGGLWALHVISQMLQVFQLY